MAHPTVQSESATGDLPKTPPPTAGEFDSPLTELTRSTHSVKHFQQPVSSSPIPNLLKKTFAEVVAPSQASNSAKTTPHKYFLADSPPPAIDTLLTGDKGHTLLFTDAETEVLAAPFKFALVGKFSHGTPSYSILHKLLAGTGIKSNFTESSIVPIWVSFPELPAHMFRKDVLFTVVSTIGTPLQIDDATLNQSKLSKAWACIELDLLKPRLEYEQIPQVWR
ncbi:UNVERIFIED_CONTAM: hypothetical protein Sindi_1355100 [Sesamum indicum]